MRIDKPLPGLPGRSKFQMQVADMRSRHPGILCLFKIGDYYEAFADDAEAAAKLLGLTLTTRTDAVSGDQMAMAGFPHHRLKAYLHKLLAAGKRVAIAEQVK